MLDSDQQTDLLMQLTKLQVNNLVPPSPSFHERWVPAHALRAMQINTN